MSRVGQTVSHPLTGLDESDQEMDDYSKVDQYDHVRQAELFFAQPAGARKKDKEDRFVYNINKEVRNQIFSLPDTQDLAESVAKKFACDWKQWVSYTEAGFNLIFYGVGSKFELLERLSESATLKSYDQLVLNGFDPLCDGKSLIETLAQHFGCSVAEISDVDALANSSTLLIILHNIDYFIIRHKNVLKILIRLAAIGSAKIIASVDHVNAALLFTPSQAASLNILWCRANTGLTHWREISSNEGSNALRGGPSLGLGSHNMDSLQSTWSSLTDNAKKIFRLLIEHVLKEKDATIGLKDLYRQARDAFLVNSEAALRAQLTEFKDHEFISLTRDASGAELVKVLVPSPLLKEFADVEDLT